MVKEKTVFLEETRELLLESQVEKDNYSISINGKSFVVYPGVFSPKYFDSTEFFSKKVPIEAGERFLEIGSGTGVVSIFASDYGADVTATDINPRAVKNTLENFRRHGLNSSGVYEGDLFQPLKSGEIFDTIFWAMPFGFVERKNVPMLERSVFDPNYESISRFVEESPKYLNTNGRLLIGFSEPLGHLDLLEKSLKSAGYDYRVICEQSVQEKSNVPFQLIEAKPIFSIENIVSLRKTRDS